MGDSIVEGPNYFINEFQTDEIALGGVVSFVIFGVILMLICMVTLWLVTGHFVRLDNKFKNQNLLKLSVIIALMWGYINGFSRLFLNTNYIVDNTLLLQFRCDDIVTFNFMNEQFNQYGVYIYLLARLRQFDLFKNGIYYSLLILISFGVLFTMIITPFYTLPTVFSVDDDPEILICGPGSVRDADSTLFAAYSGFLTPDTIAQIVLFAYCIFKTVKVWAISTAIIKRTLVATILTCFMNILELFIFIGGGGATIHGVRMIIYCIFILITLEITLPTKSGNASWCLWCTFDEVTDETEMANNTATSVDLAQVTHNKEDKES